MIDKIMLIHRNDKELRETIGELTVFDIHQDAAILKLATVELPWKDNKNKVSCIPVGIYDVEKFNSPKHGLCFLIKDVPGRDMCEIHSANYAHELLGCIAPGLTHADIDHDGLMDVTSSKEAMRQLLEIMPDHFKLTIS